MVLNLLDNAARHTPPGARIELRLRRDDGDAVVEVADDGPGIPPELRDQIFDRFVRGEGPADTAVGPGSGLGLAIVRAVADLARRHGRGRRVAERRRPLPRPPAAATQAEQPAHAAFRTALAAAPYLFLADETQGPPGSPQQPSGGPYFLLPDGAQTSTTTGRIIGRRRSFS